MLLSVDSNQHSDPGWFPGWCVSASVCLLVNAPFSLINISPLLPPCSFIKKSAKQASPSPEVGWGLDPGWSSEGCSFLVRARAGSSLLLFQAGAPSETASGMCLEWVAGISQRGRSPAPSRHFEVVSFCTSVSFLPDPFQDAGERSSLVAASQTFSIFNHEKTLSQSINEG